MTTVKLNKCDLDQKRIQVDGITYRLVEIPPDTIHIRYTTREFGQFNILGDFTLDAAKALFRGCLDYHNWKGPRFRRNTESRTLVCAPDGALIEAYSIFFGDHLIWDSMIGNFDYYPNTAEGLQLANNLYNKLKY